MSSLHVRRLAAWTRAAVAALLFGTAAAAGAQATADEGAAKPPVVNSSLDAALFYQLLIGEIELRSGQPGAAYDIVLDAARRTRDEQLFRHATEIALRARAGDQALAATRAWRAARPESLEALRLQVQILIALNRPGDLAEPLRALLQATPPGERAGLIASLPRALQRSADKRLAATTLDAVLEPYTRDATTRVAAQIASARMWAVAGEVDRALKTVRQVQAEDPAAPGPALLALDLMPLRPEAEALVVAYLKGPAAEPEVRRAYAGRLIDSQRLGDAMAQLEIATRQQPDFAPPWLTMGALQLEMRRPQDAEVSLQRFVQLVQQPKPPAEAASGAAGTKSAADDDDAMAGAAAEAGLTQAWLLLAQAAEMRGDYAAAEAWLARIDNPQRALEVQARRASLLARQGRLEEGRELIRRVPGRDPADVRAKLMVEAQLLREQHQWQAAAEVLADASRRFPNDADLLYEQSMVAEKLEQFDVMERLLREVIALQPERAHAYNALGYSLADRNQRLPEAKALIERALELAPGDPFITDSLGWVEFRLGNRDKAVELLRQAAQARPDAEIGAHLGEVLWTMGRRDEARKVWAEARSRDADNEVLRETMKRLGAAP